jgi:hypothetical protein
MRWFRFFDSWPIICFTDFRTDPPLSMRYSYVVLPREVKQQGQGIAVPWPLSRQHALHTREDMRSLANAHPINLHA